jgi:hypothetical protein
VTGVDASDASVDAEAGAATSGVDAAEMADAADTAEVPADAPEAGEEAGDRADASGPDGEADAVDAVAPASNADAAAGTCTDKRKNGDETDVDCGGSCAPCGANKSCRGDADCSATASGCDAAHGGCRCDETSKRCVFDHCFDNKSDDGESGLDCGGDVCAVCALGGGCRQNTDCSSQACDGVSSKCVANQCLDHRQDGRETDIDCGGANSCVRCRAGMKCSMNGDCQAGHTCSTDGTQVCL